MGNHSAIDTPLYEALKRIEFWLERDGASHIVVAKPSLKKLQQQRLPEHVRATPKKMLGLRQAIRGRRHYHEQHMRLARWPKDGMDENVLPFITCVISGQADFRIADYVLHCNAGDWVFFPAGIPKQDGNQPHLEGDPTGRHCDVLWIYTGMGREQGLQSWICRSKGQEHFQEQNASCWVEHRFLAQLFNGFCDELQEGNHPEVVAHLLRGVLLLMRTEIEKNNVLFGGMKQEMKPEKSLDPIEEAQFYITTNIYKHLTIQNVARQVLVSPSTLTRYFRERTGQTFTQYLNAERLKLATGLLQETDLPISIIGQKVGLKYGQLRVLFQQQYGCSPGQLRAIKSKDK